MLFRIPRLSRIGPPALAAVLLFAIGLGGCTPSNKAPGAAWENKLVRRPGDTPEDGKIYVVKNGTRHWILHAAWIGAHASELSGTGVQAISAAELEKIPLGDPITSDF